MKPSHAFETLSAYVDADIPTFLWGKPGVGKSAGTRALMASKGRELIDERLALYESVDLRGVPHIQAGQVKWAIPAMFSKLYALNGAPCALFLDEMNAAAPSVQAAAFQLVLDRAVGDHKLPGNCVVIAAGNRQSDRAAAQRMPSALANRFAHIAVDPDVDDTRAYFSRTGAPGMDIVSAFLAFRPNLIHVMEGTELLAFPSPRSWEQVARVMRAPDHLRQRLVTGLVGEAPAGELEAFVRIWRRVPSIESIIRDPNGAPVPAMNEPALMFAVAGAIARKAERGNFGAVVAYAERLPQDFTVLTVLDACRRDPSLMETRAFVSWAANNQDVTI